jgi:hypothetical protein
VACFVIQSQIDDDSTVLSFLIEGQCCGPPVSSNNKNDRHNIAEILLKVALNTIKKQTNKPTQHHCIPISYPIYRSLSKWYLISKKVLLSFECQ